MNTHYSDIVVPVKSYIIPFGEGNGTGKLLYHNLGLDHIVDVELQNGVLTIALNPDLSSRTSSVLSAIQSAISLEHYVEKGVSRTPSLSGPLGPYMQKQAQQAKEAGRYYLLNTTVRINPSRWAPHTKRHGRITARRRRSAKITSGRY